MSADESASYGFANRVKVPAAVSRVAVLVDCDNLASEVLEYTRQVSAQFGRVVIRRGYGNSSTLTNRWKDALVRMAFTPCLQFQYAAGKNTADIALALDALEVLFDERADTFCLVTSDSDFAHLCRKLRERGALVVIVGEAKTPEALRNASDQFFEWRPEPSVAASVPNGNGAPAAPAPRPPQAAAKLEGATGPTTASGPAAPRRRPNSVIDAVALLAAEAPDGRVGLGELGQYLKRADPAFSPKVYGHGTLSEMLRTYPELVLTQGVGAGMWVGVRGKAGMVKPTT